MKKQLISVLAAGMMISGAVMNAEAKTKSVYVIAQNIALYHGYSSFYGKKKTINYKYNKMGLINKESEYDVKFDHNEKSSWKYYYDRKGHIRSYKDSIEAYTYKTNSKGLVTKAAEKDGSDSISYTYNKKGLMIKDSSGSKYYYNSKGQLTKDTGQRLTYKYNKHGYVSMVNWGNKTYVTYKYYKNGLVKKMSVYGEKIGSKYYIINNYKYKKMKVNAKYATEIRRQQDALVSKNGYQSAYINGPEFYGLLVDEGSNA